MTISAGGSSGIVFPDTTTLPANQITTYLSPGLTDTANVLTANPSAKLVQFNGTTGLTVNGATLTSATGFYPVNTVAPAITGTTRDTQVLTCSTGTWSNTPTSYSYQWIRGTSTNIGTNSSTYTCVTADIGSTIKCTVTATNGVGSNSATSSSVGPITANTYTASYLLVAGGGGGGNPNNYIQSGGGGAGGMVTGTSTFTPGTVYTFTIGGGGPGSTNGTNSTFTGATTAIGGGAGSYSNAVRANNGGSGGGTAGAGGGSGTAGQGNNGGQNSGGAPGYGGGGGGGAGAAGSDGGGSNGGAGGSGAASSITGTLTYYAGGGGGGIYNATGGTGGNGGGGAGLSTGQTGYSGTANTGGGGGGAANSNSGGGGGSGGSGVGILSVPTANYSGTTTGSPTITTSGSNTIIKFTASGTYTA